MAKGGNPRTDRAVKEAIADIVEHEVADPRLKLVSITEVHVTPDAEHATVHWSILSPDLVTRDPARTGGDRVPEAHEVAAGFEAARARIQSLLARRVKLRRTPVLHFLPDPVIEQAARVEELIRRVRREEGRDE
jgi:ribosome-binding factor A